MIRSTLFRDLCWQQMLDLQVQRQKRILAELQVRENPILVALSFRSREELSAFDIQWRHEIAKLDAPEIRVMLIRRPKRNAFALADRRGYATGIRLLSHTSLRLGYSDFNLPTNIIYLSLINVKYIIDF
jgi:hypothetical protein